MKLQSKDLVDQAKKKNAAALAAAFKSGDEAQMSDALAVFMADVNDAVLAQAAEEIETRNADNTALAARGVRVLTSAEMAYYGKLADAVLEGKQGEQLEEAPAEEEAAPVEEAAAEESAEEEAPAEESVPED